MKLTEVQTCLLVDGVQFTWEEILGPENIEELVRRLHDIKNVFVMGRTASVEQERNSLIIRNEVVYQMQAFGLPIRIDKAYAKQVRAESSTAFGKGRLSEVVGVFEAPEGLFILSPYKGCDRREHNVSARYSIAKNLGCEYEQNGRQASWRGHRTVRIGI